MGWLRFSMMRSLNSSLKTPVIRSPNYSAKTLHSSCESHVRTVFGFVNRDYRVKETEPGRVLSSKSNFIGLTRYSARPNHLFSTIPVLSVGSGHRYYSSSSSANSGDANEWLDKAKGVWNSAVEVTTYTGEKVKEASAELSPQVERLLDSYPYLKDAVGPVSLAFAGTLLAWFLIPSVLRRFHRYSSQGRAAILPANVIGGEVPYEKSFWAALESPVRYLITFIAFTQIGMVLVGPTSITSQYLTPAVWRSGVTISFVWFLHQLKRNVLALDLTSSSLMGLDRVTFDKASSIGLFVVGAMALTEACGVAPQSILTVGGIGGVATAFAAKDILGNVLSGLSMQFSKPFSIGDTIKSGTIEGQVVDMRLTTTSLLTAEKFPVTVPNSLFSSKEIVNKSRAEWRAIINKIPVQVNDLDKIPEIVNDINNMLRSHVKVFLEKEAPYCFMSRIESSFAELTIGCNLKQMRKEELYSTQQDILLQSVQIIKRHGAKLGTTIP